MLKDTTQGLRPRGDWNYQSFFPQSNTLPTDPIIAFKGQDKFVEFIFPNEGLF